MGLDFSSVLVFLYSLSWPFLFLICFSSLGWLIVHTLHEWIGCTSIGFYRFPIATGSFYKKIKIKKNE